MSSSIPGNSIQSTVYSTASVTSDNDLSLNHPHRKRLTGSKNQILLRAAGNRAQLLILASSPWFHQDQNDL